MNNEDFVTTKIEKDGYAVINIQDIYFYTVGFGKQGKNDLFGFCHYPFGMFQVIASKYHNNEIVPNQAFLVEEYKLQGLGKEPARSKINPLGFQANLLIQTSLAQLDKTTDFQGYSIVLGPDKDNLLIKEEGCSFDYDVNDLVRTFIGGVHQDIEAAIKEAEKIRTELGIK